MILERLSYPILVAVLAAPTIAQMPGHWSTYLGGNTNDERIHAITTAKNGDIVVAGHTHSTNFKTTAGVYQPKSGGFKDAFLVRLAADGRKLIAATHLGGSHHEVPSWVQVAPDGTIWVGGTTQSPNFPVTANAFMKPNQFRTEAFVTQFDAALTKVLYSTVFGGSGSDTGTAFALDLVNKLIYIAGITDSGGPVPTTTSGFQRKANRHDAYLAVLAVDTKSTTLKYGTLLGGSDFESSVDGLSVHKSRVTVSGTTPSSDYPVTTGAFQTTSKNKSKSGFVTTIDPNLSGAQSLVYSTYLGGSGIERTLRHFVDASGLLHLLLLSTSADLPTTSNALQATAGGNFDVHYAQLDPSRSGSSGLRYGSWLIAGRGTDGIFGSNICMNLAPTTKGVAAVAGIASGSSSVPRTAGAFQTRWSTSKLLGFRGYVVSLDLTGSKPVVDYATLYHGCSQVLPTAVAQHQSGDLLLAGFANGAPIVSGVVQEEIGSSLDPFVSRLPTATRPPSSRVFGKACKGSKGLPKLALGLPGQLCQPIRFDVSNLPNNQRGFFIFGPQMAPVSFDHLGATGCSVFVNPLLFVFRGTGSSGAFSISFPVPKDHNLLGQELATQYIFNDPKANPLGAVATHGLAAKGRW